MKGVVPVLITWDVDPLSPKEYKIRSLDNRRIPTEHLQNSLKIAKRLTDELNIKSTFFVTASVANCVKNEIRDLIRNKHSIGCHGLTHGSEEEFDKMPERSQYIHIEKATKILQEITDERIKSFRAPRVKISHLTLNILEKLGYETDCSVSSQRIDFISSNLVNLDWFFAPRLPYHPNKNNAFKKGDMKIWEIPISALFVPFISATLSIFKTNAMKTLFNILYKESLKTGKPIVYLIHPMEFLSDERFGEKIPRKWFIPSKTWLTYGIPIRWLLFCKNGKEFYRQNRELFSYIGSFPKTEFLTIDEYIQRL